MWKQIRENKRNSIVLIFAMLLFIMFIGAVVGTGICAYLLEDAEINVYLYFVSYGVFFAVIVWLIMLLTSLTRGKQIILSRSNAVKLPPTSHKILENIVEEMTIASGLPKKPDIYVIDSKIPNAFATGLSVENSAIAVTTELLTILDRDELQGVIAHEISHIINRDTTYMLFASIMIGSIVFLAEAGLRIITGSSRSSGRRSGGNGGGNAVILVVCLILMILAPIFAQLLYFSLSRRREYLADACAAQYTRYPAALASALNKLTSDTQGSGGFDKVTAAMCIVNPLANTKSFFDNAMSTHPPIEERIKILLNMANFDLSSYNNAFRNITGRKTTIITKEELEKTKFPNVKKSDNSNILKTMTAGTYGGVGAVGLVSEHKTQQLQEEYKQRKRNAEDVVWKANEYIFKQCSCGTKLKFPKEYEGQTINCPHCKNPIIVTREK